MHAKPSTVLIIKTSLHPVLLHSVTGCVIVTQCHRLCHCYTVSQAVSLLYSVTGCVIVTQCHRLIYVTTVQVYKQKQDYDGDT